MPTGFFVLIAFLLIGSWLIIDEKPLGEKLFLLIGIAGMYVTYRLLGGAKLQDILAPVMEFFRNRNPHNL